MSDIQNTNLQPVTPQEMVVPSNFVPLPSAGKVYPQNYPLFNQLGVEIRSMTAKDEDILTSRALIRSGKLISTLLRSCLVDKTIDPDKMLVGDRNAILIGIRITGYGADYPVTITCPECASDNSTEINLTDIPIKNFPPDLQITSGLNEFSFYLPVSKKTATFKLLTGEEERELLQMLERGKKSTGAEELVTGRLKMQVTSLNGEKDPQKLANMIRQLPARDSRELRKYIDAVTPGIELKTPFTCSTCGHEGEVEVPLGAEFFWPEA